MNHFKKQCFLMVPAFFAVIIMSCNQSGSGKSTEGEKTTESVTKQYLSQPLVSHIYTADPSAHVFNGRIYVYPSHDTATGTPENDNGDHFNMMDFHVLSMDSIGGTVTDHGVGLHISGIFPGPAGSFGPPMPLLRATLTTCISRLKTRKIFSG